MISTTRNLVLPVSLVSILVVPVLVGLATADEEAPPSAEVTVQETAAFALWPRSDSLLVSIAAPGDAPATSTQLADTSGRNLATATAVDQNRCADIQQLVLPALDVDEGAGWCIEITGVGAGSSPKGTLAGTAATVTVTVSLRHAYASGPFLATLAGFLVALALLWMAVPNKRLVRRAVLDDQLARNRTAAEPITDLDSWAAGQLRRGTTVDDVVKAVNHIIDHGPPHARAQRAKLTRQLANLPATATDVYVLVAAARTEAKRTDHAVADLLKADRTDATHPATTASSNLVWFRKRLTEIRNHKKRAGRLTKACRTPLLREIGALDVNLRVIDGSERMEEFIRRRSTVVAGIERYEQLPGCQPVTADARSPWRSDAQITPLQLDSDAPPPRNGMGGHGKSQRELGGARWKAIALTSTLVIVPVALMFFSVAATTWLAKPTYGTTAEYLGTFLAAVGSTTAASVFSVLSLWTVESP